jgi:hypothetical protein
LLADLPELSRLLAAARVTPVRLDETWYDVLAWDLADGTIGGWVCLPPASSGIGLSLHHQVWPLLGGVVDHWSSSEDTWLLNQTEVLTATLAARDPAGELEAYSWIWDQDNLQIPINPLDYGLLAEEANGNQTLFHRTTGDLLLFAPDHNYDHIEPLEGCPEYSLYRIPNALTAKAWLAHLCHQWLETIH